MSITLEINGSEIVAEEGLTILEVAKRSEINIPTLCHAKGQNSDVPCGLCVVEIEGKDRLIRSCTTIAEDGMHIVTDSKELTKHRQDRLAVISSTHFGDCKAPCNLTCPGQLNVQGYIAHVAKGEYAEAVRLIMERNPFPFSVGRVCPRFCETRCRRILVDEPVSINHLKRFVADWCMANKVDLKIDREKMTGKRVAVIGGGPGGLTAAYYLAQKGHNVTIFEANPKLGGMLRYGIPDYKIPRHILDYETNLIMRMGISVRLNQKWGVDFNLQDIKDQGYDAILLATGAGVDQRLDVPGCQLPRVHHATEYLREIAVGTKHDFGKTAAVIGGNNIAMECARSLLRQGVENVTVIFHRAQEEMVANQRVIREATKEGIQFILMASPVQVSDDNGKMKLDLVRMRLGEPNERGTRIPEAIPNSNTAITVDTVVSSLGQMACDGSFKGGELEESLVISPKNTIKASPRDFITSIAGVYAAGDCVSGSRTVIQTVVSARKAANNIHAFITGEEKEPADNRFNFTRGKAFDKVSMANFDGIDIKLREKMPTRPPEIAVQDFDEVKLGFSEQMAKNEADRCLSCGCTAFDRCDLKKLDIDLKVNINKTGMGTKPVYQKDESHPVITVDLNKCIYCMRCVNSCDYDALDLTQKGLDKDLLATGISLAFNDNCVNCGSCVDHCSTGALNKKTSIVPLNYEKMKEIRSTCPYCGAGCQLLLKVKGDTLMEVSSEDHLAPNYGNLCVKGRFAHNFVQSKERLTRPLVRRHGQLVETTWEDAFNVIAKKFFDLKAMYGPDSIAGFSCARASNEENYLMQKFMRTAIGTNNIDHCARL